MDNYEIKNISKMAPPISLLRLSRFTGACSGWNQKGNEPKLLETFL